MASLPDFHSFHQAAASGKNNNSDVEMIQSKPRIVAQGPFKASEAGGGSLGIPVAQAGQVETTLDGIRDQVDDDPPATSTALVPQAPESLVTKPLGPGDDVEVISSEFASLRVKINSMPFNPEDHLEVLQQISILERLQSALVNPDSSFPLIRQETSSALAHLRATASAQPFNPQDPANVTLLQQISYLERQLAKFESGSTSNTVLPVVSIDISESIIFVTGGIATFFLNSAMLPATLAVAIIMVFYHKAGDLSPLSATLFSVLAILATAQAYLLLSAYSIIEKNQAAFNSKALSDLSKLDAASYLFVLGSGGHTTEMMSLIKLSQKPYSHTHRRYLMTVGDPYSLKQAKALEANIARRYPNGSAGTSDMIAVTRARSVHQSYISSVFTSLQSFAEIVGALTTIPSLRVGQPNAETFRSPHVIVTNGPGTGFIVGLVAFILKVLRVVPRDRLKVVFVETWARTHNLGLTGKLFNVTQIADVFVVQSEALARTVNKPNIGNVNKMWSGLVNTTSQPEGGA